MPKTRVETIDTEIREMGYPDCAWSKIGEPLLVFARNFAAEADRQESEIWEFRAIVDKLPRQPNGDYLQCPLCRQYLDADGTCPEGCGNIGQWLANYEKAQTLIDIVDTLPKCWQLNKQGRLVQDVLVVPGMTLWSDTMGGSRRLEVISLDDLESDWPATVRADFQRTGQACTYRWNVQGCYSTPEAAEKAKEATP